MNLYLQWVLKGLILLIGTLGNIIGLIIFARKSFRKRFPSGIKYILLSVMNTLYLNYAITRDFLTLSNIFINSLSNFSCKIVRFFNYSLGPLSAWLLVYISIERFFMIYYNMVQKFKKDSFHKQDFIILIIFFGNMVVYSPILFYSSLITFEANKNNTNSTIKYQILCFVGVNERKIVNIIDLVNSALLPFILMIIFSILLIISIFKSRLRILSLNSKIDRNKLLKDIKFSVSTIFQNFFFIFLNLPISTLLLTVVDIDLYQIFYCFYYISFGVNFYILFFTNSIFREEVLSVLIKKSFLNKFIYK